MPPHHPPPLADPKRAGALANHTFDNEEGAEYAGSDFGGFGEYFRNKKIKLQNLDAHIRESDSGSERPLIFKGCIVHVNGYTKPSIGEIHRLVVIYGGVFSQYMDGKTAVTHIIASSLTPKKLVEFARYRVVKPEWITQSIEAGKLLPWHDYRVIQPSESQRRLSIAPVVSRQENGLSSHSPCPSCPGSPPTGSLAGYREQGASCMPSRICSPLIIPSKSPENFVSPEEHNAALLANPNTRNSTVLNPDFLKTYYEQSRLHHLSTWKASLKLKIQNLISASSTLASKRPLDLPPNSRVIFHVDFDCFFASIAVRGRPQYADKPVSVGHGGNQNSEVASCNYVAREFGVRNGMWMRRAKELCPELITLPYEFDAYEEASGHMYNVLTSIGADKIEAVSIDEALLDVTSICWSPNDDQIQAKSLELAQSIRDRVFELTQCHVSVGIGGNILQSKIATKWAKPAGQYRVRPREVGQLINGLKVEDLPGIGYSIGAQLNERFNIDKVGDILNVPKSRLQCVVGVKTGDKLCSYAQGEDFRQVGEVSMRKSVSAEVNWGVRFETKEQVDTFLGSLAGELSNRLLNLGMIGKNLTLKVYKRAENAPLEPTKYLGCGECDAFSRSYGTASPTSDADDISRIAILLLGKLQIGVGDIRGLGLQMTKLVPAHGEDAKQVTLFQMKGRPKGTDIEVLKDKRANLEGALSEEGNLPLEIRATMMRSVPPKLLSTPATHDFFRKRTGKEAQPELLEVVQMNGKEPQPELSEVVQMNCTEISAVNNRMQKLKEEPQVMFEIPSQSSIDPDVLSELPPEIVKEIQEQYRGSTTAFRSPVKNAGSPGAKRLKFASSIKKLSSSKTGSLNTIRRPRNDSNLSGHEKLNSVDSSRWALNVDEDILKELPQDIRKEILEERQHHLRTSPAGKRKEELEPSTSIELQHSIPTFQGKNQIDDLRNLLQTWLLSSVSEMQGPHMDDVHLLEKYLSRVITEEVNLSKAVELVNWVGFQVENVLMERSTDDRFEASQGVLFEWVDIIDGLQKAVSIAAAERGLYNIQFH
ncbi:hypothetical protein V1517DRAFT_282147 [Lipomyces orientalis]|uniref:Uncharacterized protein n=1 Tax=Lipomyces orientalis TaxID=1233043 RepID=A0ACC3TDM0_9ASCO